MFRRGGNRASRGITLIELMISMTIGTIVLTTAIGLMISSSRARKTVDHMAAIQEEAQFVSQFLKQQLLQIGYRGIDPSVSNPRIMPLRPKSARFTAVGGQWLQEQTLRVDGPMLTYRFDGSSDSTGAADASIFDCHGTAVPYGPVQEVSILLQDRQLICRVAGVDEVLAGSNVATRTNSGIGIEAMVMQLGVDGDGDGSVDRIIEASTATDAEFVDARHLTIRLLFATKDDVVRVSRPYRFNNTDIVATDKRLRSEAVISVALRN
jgi:type II secretory pathway pseudopilin PulG